MNRYGVIALVALFMFFNVFNRTSDLRAIAGERSVRVALVYTAGGGTQSEEIRAAFAETMRENGLPFDWLASTDLALFSGEQLYDAYAAIVFPDTINRRISEDAVAALTSFSSLGGSIAIVGDAGSRTADGTYRPGSLFSEVSGVDDFLYRSLRAKAFENGKVHFTDSASIDRWAVPSGKVKDGDLSGYLYGPLDYSFSRAIVVTDDVRVDANHESTPMFSVRPVGRGQIAFIGLPLGYLRTHSDAFPMTMLSAFLTRSGEMPHLVAAPEGIGQLIVDFHIDSSIEFTGIPNLRRRGLLRHDVPMEFDVTAGPDRDRVGDGLGFEACGRGRQYLKAIMPYGRIGSHGGWAHNLFAKNLEAGNYSFSQIRALVDRNDRCLESVTGVPLRSYAAPSGVHPQPLMTNVLDSLGIKGYYYTGDTGAPVERPFYNGLLVSEHSWAFPVMPMGGVASFGEMHKAKIAPLRVEHWLDDTARYAAERHGIYLFYSHSYDLVYSGYADAMSHFLDRVEAMEKAGQLRTTDMVTAAAFMDRFVTTTSSFTRSTEGVHVQLYNAAGLHAIAFAVPSAWIRPNVTVRGIRQTSSAGGYRIFSVDGSGDSLDLTIPGAST